MPSKISLAAALSGVVFLFSAGCASDEKVDDVGESKSELRCVADVIEADLDMSAVGGSALDEATGTYKLQAGEEVFVSSTYGIPKPGPGGKKLSDKHQELMGRIVQQLQTQPGLLALQLGQSESCNSGRTLAVWESEELMYEFVTSAPHLEAMKSANELLQPGYAVTHWKANASAEMSLETAAQHLGEALEH